MRNSLAFTAVSKGIAVFAVPLFIAFFPFLISLSAGATVQDAWFFYTFESTLYPSIGIAVVFFAFFLSDWIVSVSDAREKARLDERMEALKDQIADIESESAAIAELSSTSPALARARMNWFTNSDRLNRMNEEARSLVALSEKRLRDLS